MSEITIRVPNVAHIVVIGPTQCGKSIVMDRIEKALKTEFSANVISEDLRVERNGNNYEKLDDWQKQMVSQTTWVMIENK
jgi:predicted AAA+ superfamily ATPase